MATLEERLHAASIPERNRAIRDARDAGWTLRAIAEAVGLTHGGVRKILQKEEP